VGRDPRAVRRSWSGGCACAPTRAEAEQLAGDEYNADNPEDDFGFVGTPDQLVAQMRQFVDLGIDTFLLDCGGFPRLTTLELLIGEVLPAMRAGTTP
jgi:alkanesulfonate monooxygenase SsuD/methylene tetrahydromethanopterin reductase-like flavin-dependent oxidoreductase (luciferase family)